MDWNPTAFANVNTYKPNIADRVLNAQMAANADRRAQETHDAEMLSNKQFKDIMKRIKSAYDMNDSTAYSSGIAELTAINPDIATKVDAVYGGMNKQKRVEAAYRLYGAAALGDENIDLQNKLLSQAANNIGTNDIFYPAIQAVQAMPAGKERTKELLTMVHIAKNLGYYPKGQKAEKTADILEREISDKEVNTLLRKQELELKAATEKRLKGQLSEGEKERLATTADEANTAHSKAVQIGSIIKRIEANPQGVGGGAFAKFGEHMKKLMGTGDANTALRQAVDQLRVKEGMTNLPPGPASDKDIQIALGPLPDSSANPEVIKAWFRGLQKMHLINEAYQVEKFNYISEHKNLGGFMEYWDTVSQERIGNRFKAHGLSVNTESQIKEVPASKDTLQQGGISGKIKISNTGDLL